MTGTFLSFDGVDGAGKSTQIELFVEWLRAAGHTVVTCRDPGTTPLGGELRKLLLHRHDLGMDGCAEMFLYMAARAQLVAEVIRPALQAGNVVVCDRFLLANIVYQGHAGGLDVEAVRQVGRVAVGGVEPTFTFVLDMPAEQAAARIARTFDRMEARGLEFLRAVRRGFLEEAARQPERIGVIDAQGTPAEVHSRILALATRWLPAAR